MLSDAELKERKKREQELKPIKTIYLEGDDPAEKTSAYCPNCGTLLKSKSKKCTSCGQRVEILFSKCFHTISLTSLILGCLGIGIFSCFNFIIIYISLNASWATMSCFTFLTVIGIVLASISLKKGKKVYSIIGLLLNIIALGIMIFWIFLLALASAGW